MRAWGCIASVDGLPHSRKQACQVPQTSLICTSTQLSPCSEHLVRCGSSAVVLGFGCSRLGLRVRLWAVQAGFLRRTLLRTRTCVCIPIWLLLFRVCFCRHPLQKGSAVGDDDYWVCRVVEGGKTRKPSSRGFRLFVLEGEEAIFDLSKFILAQRDGNPSGG